MKNANYGDVLLVLHVYAMYVYVNTHHRQTSG